jgi:hypothetical protein
MRWNVRLPLRSDGRSQSRKTRPGAHRIPNRYEPWRLRREERSARLDWLTTAVRIGRLSGNKNVRSTVPHSAVRWVVGDRAIRGAAASASQILSAENCSCKIVAVLRARNRSLRDWADNASGFRTLEVRMSAGKWLLARAGREIFPSPSYRRPPRPTCMLGTATLLIS